MQSTSEESNGTYEFLEFGLRALLKNSVVGLPKTHSAYVR
jgi:hypothetical protein